MAQCKALYGLPHCSKYTSAGSMVKDMRDHLLGVRALWWTLLVAIALQMHATP